VCGVYLGICNVVVCGVYLGICKKDYINTHCSV
jgi:hypothetical protein